MSGPVSSNVGHWTVNQATKVRFLDSAGQFCVIDHGIHSTVNSLYLCSGMYRSSATSAGKLLDGMPGNVAVAELCSGKFSVAGFRDLE
jgi:hypothetical protein